MKIALIALALTLTGCALPQVQTEPSDRYSKLEPATRLDVAPVPLPVTDKLQIKQVDGTAYAVLDSVGVQRLSAYEAAAKQNTEALQLLINAHNGLVDQRNVMLQTLNLEEDRANFFQQRYAETENARRQQYQEFSTELLIHKTMIVFMGILLVL
jgi:hypothetical protein